MRLASAGEVVVADYALVSGFVGHLKHSYTVLFCDAQRNMS